MARILVATCGNCTAGDDSFGPRLGQLLRESPIAGVDVVDLDIKPAALFDYLPGPDCLILADAVRIPGRDPGQVIRIDLAQDDLPVLLNDDAMSSHGLGLAHQLALARELDLIPGEAWLIGMTLETSDPESAPGPRMDAALEHAHRLVLELSAGSAQV